jgi:hypothetical protein
MKETKKNWKSGKPGKSSYLPSSVYSTHTFPVLHQKDRCTEQHKASDDRRNASTWKGCDDTGLFGCCCRHDSVIYFCNIHKSGEGRGLPMSLLKRLLGELSPNIQLRVLYDIGCTLGKFFKSQNLLTDQLPRMKFATAVFHSYVHDWACQLKFNPQYNNGWGGFRASLVLSFCTGRPSTVCNS